MTMMSACERACEGGQEDIGQECPKDGQDFKSNINKAVNNVLEGWFFQLFCFSTVVDSLHFQFVLSCVS